MHIINFTRNLLFVDCTGKPVMLKLRSSVIVTEAYLNNSSYVSVTETKYIYLYFDEIYCTRST